MLQAPFRNSVPFDLWRSSKIDGKAFEIGSPELGISRNVIIFDDL
jgi:hypothetical protein